MKRLIYAAIAAVLTTATLPAFCNARGSGRHGDRRPQRPAPADEAEPGEADQHHRPSGRFGHPVWKIHRSHHLPGVVDGAGPAIRAARQAAEVDHRPVAPFGGVYPVGNRASFGATLHKQVATTLRSRGHKIDDCDLYAESFDPVMGEQERVQYHNAELNRAPIAGYADRLLAAEALVLIYPVWNEGFPAILKGFFDRVFIPGVSFKIGPGGAAVPNLQKLRKLAAVCTYGASRTTSFLLGDPPKRVVKRLVRSMPGHAVRCDYLAYYDMDHSDPEQRAAFLEKVKRTFEAW